MSTPPSRVEALISEFGSALPTRRGWEGLVLSGEGCQRSVGTTLPLGHQRLVVANRDVTDRRAVDVALDEPRIAVSGGGSDLSSLVRHPCAGQELASAHPSADFLDRRPVRSLGSDLRSHHAVRSADRHLGDLLRRLHDRHPGTADPPSRSRCSTSKVCAHRRAVPTSVNGV